ncbi:hypothetical protein DWV75_03860 [Ruminococcus sp. AF12-5]|jgi:hypothetical protein|nr:hypothetical protein DWV75_03860 [Ruminococcus sp. AF12-5]
MNLKEAFRYQNFLDRIFGAACVSIEKRDHCLTQTRNHLYNKVNPDMENVKEEVKTEEDFFANDDVIQAMLFLIEEKEKLSIAINKAKESIDMDIDAAVSVNKYRQLLNKSVAFMMRLNPCTRIETGIAQKFNSTGDPVDYKYDVEVTSVEAYDRKAAKKIMKKVISEADKTSAAIDFVKVNTTVDYTPVFDVNDSFEDVMNTFLEMQGNKEQK